MKAPTYRWRCQECGHLFRTLEAAKHASFSSDGCPTCGGADIDLSLPVKVTVAKSVVTPVEVSVATYRSMHGAAPRGPGHWGFVMGKIDYDFLDEVDAKGRTVIYYPTAPSGMTSSNMPFAMAKKYAIAEAKRRGICLISVAP